MISAREPTVGLLAAVDRELREVLEELGIDYVCAGVRSLADVCAAHGTSERAVLERLGRLPHTDIAGSRWFQGTLSSLVAYLRADHTQLRFVSFGAAALAFEAVADRHVRNNPAFARAWEIVSGLSARLHRHFAREEHVVFALIEEMEDARAHGSDAPPRLSRGLSEVMGELVAEHQQINDLLADLRRCRLELACDAHPPCAELCERIRALEAQLHESMNIKNSVLFPRAVTLEWEVYGSAVSS